MTHTENKKTNNMKPEIDKIFTPEKEQAIVEYIAQCLEKACISVYSVDYKKKVAEPTANKMLQEIKDMIANE